MSLTSQLKDKNSPVRRFFAEFEDIRGLKSCLALLQSTAPLLPSLLPDSASAYSYAYVGTTLDYLIRYTGNKNSLDFEHSIAKQALRRGGKAMQGYLQSLFSIAKNNLDGRDATDHDAIYSATALSVMDGVFRSGFLPKIFYQKSQLNKSDFIKKLDVSRKEKLELETRYILDSYVESLGGDKYKQDIALLVDLFVKKYNEVGSEFFGSKIIVGSQALNNSWLVGGADFDCIIESQERLILTDIKTTMKPLKLEYLRQIIGYSLLYNEEQDGFKFTDMGIYHSRSGSFRHLSLNYVIEKSLPSLNSIVQARHTFVDFLEQDRQKKLEEWRKYQAEIEALRAIELAKAEALKEKRRLARLAKVKAIKSGEYELIKKERALTKEKARIEREQASIACELIKQERALVKEKARIEREQVSIARANKRRENEKCRREKAIARRLARQLNQDVDNSK